MVQSQVTTNTGFAEMAKYIAGEASNALCNAICLKTNCCATEVCTAADLTNCTESGLTILAGTVITSQTTCANDTIQLDRSFNAQASATVLGFAIFNADNDIAIGICCFDAAVPLVTNDLLNVQFKQALAIQGA